MTLIVSWAALDCKNNGPSVASIYFASDSRYSWMQNRVKYDYGQKVFGCTNMPEIFAFCGDVNCPKKYIDRIITQIDCMHFFSYEMNGNEKSKLIYDDFCCYLDKYEKQRIVANFQLFYGTRACDGFHIFRFDYDKKTDCVQYLEVTLPNEYSDIVICEGSGKNDFEKLWTYNYGEKNFNYRTSRAVYQCLYETLSTTEEWTVGRIPQIVGLYRKFNSRFYGIIHDGKRYCIGSTGIIEVNDSAIDEYNNLEWRNECFEIADPNWMKRMEGAQPQPFFQKKQLPGSPLNKMK